MFKDRLRMRAQAGKGGNGAVCWRREPFIPKGGPAGGNGGQGGSVYIEADSSINSLDHLRYTCAAEKGEQGGQNRRQGKRGRDLTLRVPLGTLIRTEDATIDLTEPGQKHLLCQGGKGGLGNAFFKRATNQAPNKSTPGKPGEMKEVELELKIIADIGLIGMPNAGKTTLLSALGNHEFKAGAYPFTTLSPNLTRVTYDDYIVLQIADIPGIIEGAHNDRGLGLRFLRHIERCKALLFVLDGTAEDPAATLAMLRAEIAAHDPTILDKPSLVLINKSDDTLSDKLPEGLHISALEKTGIDRVKQEMRSLCAT